MPQTIPTIRWKGDCRQEYRMPRAPRNLIEGGLYHVYIRFARGVEVFADPEEAIEFLDLLRDLKQRDDLQVFAWSLLSNHFHPRMPDGCI